MEASARVCTSLVPVNCIHVQAKYAFAAMTYGTGLFTLQVQAHTYVARMLQVVDFGFESGIVDLQVGEATVGSMELTFLDPKTNSPKAQGATKPSVIERHLTTQVSKYGRPTTADRFHER